MLAFDLRMVEHSRRADGEAANDGGVAFAVQVLMLSPLYLEWFHAVSLSRN